MNKEIYIVRHGRTEFNRLGIWQGSSVDAPLDEMGIQQASLFYEAYKNKNFDLIIHSQLLRSKQTIAAFSDQDIPILEKSDINEISWGLQEGKAHTEASLGEYKSVINSWQNEDYGVSFQGGESANDLLLRIGRFVKWLALREQKKILICSHGRAIRALICLMKGEPLKEMEKYKHHNTGVFSARYESGYFSFEMMNNTNHLVQISF
jgi:probable phosphoglycerate mutase